eukprot:CAMPEP_0172397000 /NCGR_PEP_ID=MMETSP1061-20121228/28390_1 /TAXON_ID=37318 /ORGANISM="Pseudo-nitzschia pungens, Strain cf. pungens" /LENGTH=309 /DNA_ID=CAMNT_0013129029 /DNA_START=20 /DNA_END=949 /DNA_ORIENTATION=-
MAKRKSQGSKATAGKGSTQPVGEKKKRKGVKQDSSSIMKTNAASNKKTKSNSKGGNKGEIDWIAALAKQNTSNDDGVGTIPSKEDRKRKRELKKNRRLEQQKQKQIQQQQQGRQTQSIDNLNARRKSEQLSSQQEARSVLLLELSKERIRRLTRTLKVLRKSVSDGEAKGRTRLIPYYDLPKGSNPKAPRTSHASNSDSKKRKRQKWTEDSIQPLRSDYSGIGLARDSMYIEFIDPSYFPKLEEEFQEHIPGFFGKQRTKAMKRQTDGNMLWRRLANEKKNGNKKFKGMSADERVQAMIDSSDRAGLLG